MCFCKRGEEHCASPKVFLLLLLLEGIPRGWRPSQLAVMLLSIELLPLVPLCILGRERGAAFVPSGCEICFCWSDWKFFFDLKAIRMSALIVC